MNYPMLKIITDWDFLLRLDSGREFSFIPGGVRGIRSSDRLSCQNYEVLDIVLYYNMICQIISSLSEDVSSQY